MSTMKSKLAAAAVVLLFGTGMVIAQTPPPAATTTPPVAVKKKGVPKTATTEAGIYCSGKADELGLKGRGKGKERAKYRRKCISAYKKGTKM